MSTSEPASPPPPPALMASDVAGELRALGWDARDVNQIGVGHWSVCFGFEALGRRLVIRCGHYRDDFDRDRAAYRFVSPQLPVPETLEIGRAFEDQDLQGDQPGCFYSISQRIDGTPLEMATAGQWAALIPSVADALEAMRSHPLHESAGWGDWLAGPSGPPTGSHAGWRDYLLESISSSGPVQARTPGWEAKLATNSRGAKDFAWGEQLLRELLQDGDLLDAVEKGITHQDMLHGNVYVLDDRVTGLFDWGCATYSDHLYEFAMFEFWNPWHPAIDVAGLRSALERRWAAAGFRPRRVDDRLRICHLHNGLVHLAYCAHLENWDTVAQVGNRMRQLIGP